MDLRKAGRCPQETKTYARGINYNYANIKRTFIRKLHYTRTELNHNKFKLRPPLKAGCYVRSTTVSSTALRRTGVASISSAVNLDNSTHLSIKSLPYLMITALLLCINLQQVSIS